MPRDATPLRDRVAVITGGTRGLGRWIAAAFLAAGARVVIAARTPVVAADDEVDAALADGRALFLPVDVASAESVAELFGAAQDWAVRAGPGHLDVVVANAGVSRPGPVAALSPHAWAEVVAVNINGVFHTLQTAVPYLEKAGGGRVITLSSALSTRPAPGAGAYAASKAAVEALTRAAAVELAARNIAVNCLAPGFIDEGMGRVLAANDDVWPVYREKLAAGRLGTGDELARAAVFLAGDDSAYVNGHVLEVNGGLRW